MTGSEKVAYLKGLMEGMKLGEDSDNGKLFHAITDVLESMAESLADMENDLDELSEELDCVCDDVEALEECVFGDDDDDDWDDLYNENDPDDEEDEPQFFEITCPSCDKTITIDEDVLELGSVQCPNCGEMMEFDLYDAETDEDGEGE